MEQMRKRKGKWSERKRKRGRGYETLQTRKIGHQVSSIPNLFQFKLH